MRCLILLFCAVCFCAHVPCFEPLRAPAYVPLRAPQVAYISSESTCLGLHIPLEAAENLADLQRYQERQQKRQKVKGEEAEPGAAAAAAAAATKVGAELVCAGGFSLLCGGGCLFVGAGLWWVLGCACLASIERLPTAPCLPLPAV